MSACQFSEVPTPGLHSERCPHIGVRLGGSDDAMHLISAESDYRTLCDLYAPSRNVMLTQRSVTHGLGGWDGCWTCFTIRDAERSAP